MSCGRIAAKLEPCQTNSENFRHTVLSHIKFPLSHGPRYKHVRRTAAKHSRSSSEPAPLKPKMLFQAHSCSKANSHTTFLKCGNSNMSTKKGKNKMFQHSCSYGLDGMYMYLCICICAYVFMYMYLCICIYVYVFMYICIYVYVFMYMYMYLCICIYVLIYVYVNVYVFMYIIVYLYVHLYVSTFYDRWCRNTSTVAAPNQKFRSKET